MQRVALVAPSDAVRDMLVCVADEGTVELDTPVGDGERLGGDAQRRLQRLQVAPGPPLLARSAPDLDVLELTNRTAVLAGEAQLEERLAQAVGRGSVSAMVGWTPSAQVPRLALRLAALGGGVVPLPMPAGVDPPSLLQPRGAGAPFVPLVEGYAAVPYADVDPSALAGFAYVVMFGMMFADAGHGLLLLLGALALRYGRPHRFARLRAAWPFLLGAGVASAAFGVLYGEFFGPTGLVPVVWLEPLEHPERLLTASVAAGALLLAVSYVVGSVNRWREGGWRVALYAPSGLAGSTLFLGFGLVAGGAYLHAGAVVAGGAVVVTSGLLLSFVGLLAGAGGGAAGVVQASVELFDIVVRLGSNVVSFARLAAFGLTHAALGDVVWRGTGALWGHGLRLAVGAVAVFLVGNAISFSLEALVAAVQALRLEYYELFSRIFTSEGRAFRPWHVPLADEEGAP